MENAMVLCFIANDNEIWLFEFQHVRKYGRLWNRPDMPPTTHSYAKIEKEKESGALSIHVDFKSYSPANEPIWIQKVQVPGA